MHWWLLVKLILMTSPSRLESGNRVIPANEAFNTWNWTHFLSACGWCDYGLQESKIIEITQPCSLPPCMVAPPTGSRTDLNLSAMRLPQWLYIRMTWRATLRLWLQLPQNSLHLMMVQVLTQVLGTLLRSEFHTTKALQYKHPSAQLAQAALWAQL